MIGEIDCLRKSCKWYKKYFLHLLDVSLLNAKILHQSKTNSTMSLRECSKAVCEDLIAKYSELQQMGKGVGLATKHLCAC